MAKKKKTAPTPRNPMLRDLQQNPLYREKKGASVFDKAAKKDPFDRKRAKHKKVEIDESAVYFDGEQVATYRMEKRPGRITLGEALIVETGRVILKMAQMEKTFPGWNEAEEFVASEWSPQAQADALLGEVSAARHEAKKWVAGAYFHEPIDLVFEDFQWGDKVKVRSGPLKDILDKAEKLRKKKQSEKSREPEDPAPSKKSHDEGVVKEPNGPATTVGITVDGQYHIVDEGDLELIYEGFEKFHSEVVSEEDYDDLLEFRFIETTAGVRVPVSAEEQEILDKCQEKMYKSSLDERDQEVARRMVSRGVLNRHKDENGRLYFVQNTRKLTRF